MNAFERTPAMRLLTFAAITILASCSGNGHSTLSPGSGLPPLTNTPKTAPPANASASLTISIPSSSKTLSGKRHARYISSATNSVSFTPLGGTSTVINLSSTSPNCTTDANGARSCAVSVSAPSGPNSQFTISTFASVDGTGMPLSTAKASQSIVPGQPNAINVTLDAVVSQLVVSLTTPTFTLGQAATSTVLVNVLDAAGKTIVVGTNNLVDAADNAVTIALTSDSTTTLSASTLGTALVTLTYAGAATSSTGGNVSATASTSSNASVAAGTAAFSFGTAVQAAYAAAVKANSPLVYYRLNEPTGTTAVDSFGNAHPGTYTGTYGLDQPGMIAGDVTARSATFTKGYVNESITWTNPEVTAEAWVRLAPADLVQGADPRLIDNGWADSTGKGFMLFIHGGRAQFSASWNNAMLTTPLVAGKLYYLAGTFSPAVGTTLYVNGLAVANQPNGISNYPNTGDSAVTYFGAMNAASPGPGLIAFLQGSMGEAAVYDHALTPDDIAAHYNAGASAHIVPVPIPTQAPTPVATAPPTPMPLGTPIATNPTQACIFGTVYSNVLPSGEGEFTNQPLDRAWWGRYRGDGAQNAQLGNWVTGVSSSTWGRTQYDTYFGDSGDGLPGGHDPFSWGPDTGAPGNPNALKITAQMMPADLVGNPQVAGQPFYAGMLMTPIKMTYGYIVARVRTPNPAPGLSPAFWVLQGQGVQAGPHGNLSDEWDIQEMFGNDIGNGMNQGELIWNSSASGPVQNWGGSYNQMPNGAGAPSADYHDYGVLISPGGAPINPDWNGQAVSGATYGDPKTGGTFFFDGQPVYGHTGGADINLTATTPGYKEIMAMFQVSKGGWLGAATAADLPASYYLQYIRAYQPTTAHC
jgi:hypothetical protein